MDFYLGDPQPRIYSLVTMSGPSLWIRVCLLKFSSLILPRLSTECQYVDYSLSLRIVEYEAGLLLGYRHS